MSGSVTRKTGSPKPGGGVRPDPAAAARPVGGVRPAVAASQGVGGGEAAARPVGGAPIPPPVVATTVPTTKTSKPLYEAYRDGKLDVAHKAAIIKILQQLTFTPLDQLPLVKIDICLKKGDPITSILCENVEQRKAIMGSLENIRNAASAVTPSDLAKLAKHFDGMVKSGLDKLLIDCCVKDNEKAACAAARVSIAALPAESSRLAKECENLTTDKLALSTRLNSEETPRLSAHQTLTTETEALRLEIQALQQSQLMSISLDNATEDIRTEVNAYNAAIQAQNTGLAAQKDAIVALGKEIQQKKTDTASSLDNQKKDLDARHVELEKQAQSLSALKSKLTDDISMLDVMITASNSGHLAYVCTESVEAALSQWALAQLVSLATALGTKEQPASFLNELEKVQKKIQTETMRMTAAAFSPLYGTLDARPPETDAKIDACLTRISTQLVEFDSAYKAYSDLLAPYKKEVTEFNKANATALTAVNTLVAQQAEAIAKLESSLAAASVENDSKKSDLTTKITLLNEASQKAGTETSAITAKLNIKITQYNANIGRLDQMEGDQQRLVDDVASSNVAISAYNQDVAGLEDAVSVAKEDKAHIAKYNSSTKVQDHRKEIALESMRNAPKVIADFKAQLQQSLPSEKGSGGASGSDPYLLLSYDTRVSFTTLDLSNLEIPPQIRPLDCRSLSSSFAPIAVATGKEIETIQARLSEIRVVIPKAEDCVSDITVQDATTIAREFPSIRMLAQPNQPEITVRAPFITEEMLKTHGEVLVANFDASSDRIKNWTALRKAVTQSKTQVTCPIENQKMQQAWVKAITGQKKDTVWSSTTGPNGKWVPTYRLDYQMTAQPKAADNSAKTAELNASLQKLTQQLKTG